MTVCGEKLSGVCVMGKCPYFKRCCPVVWDKTPYKPQTNDEWRKTCSAEEFAEEIVNLAKDDFKKLREYYWLIANDDKDALMIWLKEKHND